LIKTGQVTVLKGSNLHRRPFVGAQLQFDFKGLSATFEANFETFHNLMPRVLILFAPRKLLPQSAMTGESMAPIPNAAEQKR